MTEQGRAISKIDASSLAKVLPTKEQVIELPPKTAESVEERKSRHTISMDHVELFENPITTSSRSNSRAGSRSVIRATSPVKQAAVGVGAGLAGLDEDL